MKKRGMVCSFVAKLQKRSTKNVCYIVAAAFLAGAFAAVPPARAQDTSITVQLTSPVAVGSIHKGDAITGQVTSPPSLNGDTIQGRVLLVKSGGQSLVQFTFDSIRHASTGAGIPITAQIQYLSNSKGQPAVDDRGQATTTSNIAAKAPKGKSRFGAQLGGLVGGTAGEVASDASDDAPDPKGSPASMQIAAQGSLDLEAGAVITISARSNGGPALASLTPNAAPPTSAPVPASPSAPASVSARASTSAPVSVQEVAASGASGGAQPELKSTAIEFVPGEKTILFDDFSDMVVDEPPPHWKVREGTVELRTGGDVRELYAKDSVNLTSGKVVVPSNFTFELEWTGGGEMVWHFVDKDDHDVLSAIVRGEEDGMTASAMVNGPDGELGSGQMSANTDQPVKFALWAQQGRLRAYINGKRLVDANQVEFGAIDHIFVEDSRYRPNGLRTIRVAESAPDFSTVINASGKYVTHGINFDTDSDHLKPESSAVLKQVAAGLSKNPNLKLEIDGYTDSVGDSVHNLDLSKRRAQAVQAVLVSQFGIDASRLSSNGFGAAKPIGSNDTPDGRASNRRVEFVKK